MNCNSSAMLSLGALTNTIVLGYSAIPTSPTCSAGTYSDYTIYACSSS